VPLGPACQPVLPPGTVAAAHQPVSHVALPRSLVLPPAPNHCHRAPASPGPTCQPATPVSLTPVASPVAAAPAVPTRRAPPTTVGAAWSRPVHAVPDHVAEPCPPSLYHVPLPRGATPGTPTPPLPPPPPFQKESAIAPHSLSLPRSPPPTAT
jgi:hypothetical protein